jgi:hypothetical protein
MVLGLLMLFAWLWPRIIFPNFKIYGLIYAQYNHYFNVLSARGILENIMIIFFWGKTNEVLLLTLFYWYHKPKINFVKEFDNQGEI